MAPLVSLTIRTLHVVTMAMLVGGSVAVWDGYRSDAVAGLTAARRYEWLFWGAVGILVVTGVGNLGSLGAPGPATDWGRTLLVKLSLVVAFLCGSVVRTLAVVRAGAVDGSGRTALRRPLARAYGATSAVLLAIVVLAEALAHG